MTAVLLVVAGVGLALLLWALARLQRQGTHSHGKILQRHHGYYGFVLAVVGALLIGNGSTLFLILGSLLYVVGLWWLADDCRQHLKQYRKPHYLSPWHRWAHSVGLI